MTMSANRRRFYWLALAIMLMAGLGLYSWLNKSVILVADGKRIETNTFQRSVQDVLTENKIVLKTADKTKPALDTLVDDNTVIEVIRDFPVKVVMAGQNRGAFARPTAAGLFFCGG